MQTVPIKARRGAPYDFLVKLLLIGDSGVGKTSLLLRFADDNFTPSFISTLGIDFKVRTVEIRKKRVKLQIWDTAGQERFRTIAISYYRGAMGVMIVYDVSQASTFANVPSWLRSVRENTDFDTSVLLVGNKSDVAPRQVDETRAIELALEHGIASMETSAKNALNVDAAFLKLAEDVVRRRAEGGDFPTQTRDEEEREIRQSIELTTPTKSASECEC